jgi:hypothetical protein
MAVDLNTLSSPEELFEHLEWWRLQLLFPAQSPAQRQAAAGAVLQVLGSRKVVAAVQTGYPVPLGLRVTVLVAVHQDRVVLFDDEGSLSAALDPESLGQALALHAGAWVMELDEEPSLLAGDEAGLTAALEALGEAEADPFSPVQSAAIHYGEPDASIWGVAIKGVKTRGHLHRDVAVLSGEPGPESGVVAGAASRSASLTLRSFGAWWGLAYFSKADMEAKVKLGAQREPTLALALGLGASLLPDSPAPREGAAAGAGPAELTPAQRLARALGAAHMVADPRDVDALEGAMSQVRAEQSIASLARCVPAPGTLVVSGGVQSAAWLPEAADAVEMLGFDPQWVDVLAGRAPEPAGGEEIVPKGVLAGTAAAIKTEFKAENAASLQRQQAASGASRLIWARSWKPAMRYTVGIVELLLAALFLFWAPLPWAWANPLLAALLTLDGAWQVWDTIRIEERAKRGPDDTHEGPSSAQ